MQQQCSNNAAAIQQQCSSNAAAIQQQCRNYSRRSQLKLHYTKITLQAPLLALTTGQDKKKLNVVPELAITGQRERIGEHDVTLII
ncbi:activating signal cointegrator 1 complex subunit 2 [Biomphalaria pfeifferi]|uniref:Activating signal cointegrator 1 complex subunit 2 n=1 Tax=Biomphalaria pfeifferi TaxID=112525 RepID=A0AAD8ASQ1_BIOPF|nr:activating signal cointegrator 1 complex subunit 2 [Biomphalaria pfeifferi]